jgi:hypothetical protein
VSATTDRHATEIMGAAKQLPLSADDQYQAGWVGVTAGIAESSLLMYANDGTSTDIKYGTNPPQQLTAQERAVAKESMNYPHDKVGNNLDSMGLFQQRPGADWGPPHELMDGPTSAGKFYHGAGYNQGLMQIKGWQDMSIGQAAQAVQKSPPHDLPLYEQSANTAKGYMDRLWTGSGPPVPTQKTWYQTLYGT